MLPLGQAHLAPNIACGHPMGGETKEPGGGERAAGRDTSQGPKNCILSLAAASLQLPSLWCAMVLTRPDQANGRAGLPWGLSSGRGLTPIQAASGENCFPRNCKSSMWTVIAVSQGGYGSFPLLVLVPKPQEKGQRIHCLAPNTTAPPFTGSPGGSLKVL